MRAPEAFAELVVARHHLGAGAAGRQMLADVDRLFAHELAVGVGESFGRTCVHGSDMRPHLPLGRVRKSREA